MNITARERSLLLRALRYFCDSEADLIDHKDPFTDKPSQSASAVKQGERDIQLAISLMNRLGASGKIK